MCSGPRRNCPFVEAAKVRLNGIDHPYMVEAVEGDDVVLASLSNGGLLELMAFRLLHR